MYIRKIFIQDKNLKILIFYGLSYLFFGMFFLPYGYMVSFSLGKKAEKLPIRLWISVSNLANLQP